MPMSATNLHQEQTEQNNKKKERFITAHLISTQLHSLNVLNCGLLIKY